MKIKNPYLRLVNIAHHRGPKKVFEGVNVSVVSHQVIGLIGPNGAGKSTLLQILSGDIDPWEGIVETKGDIGMVTQGFEVDKKITVLEYLQGERDLEDWEIMLALGKADGGDIDVYKSLSTLSGGQQTKVRITKCLLDEVDILLLDEPTNHLDIAGIKALQGLIKRFHGPVVIVSHDRQFLDDVVTGIFDLRFGNIEEYVGKYTTYMQERAERMEKQMHARRAQEKKRKDMEKWLAELRQRASIYDSKSIGKMIRSRQKLYDRTFVDGALEKPTEENEMGMAIGGGKHKGKKILHLEEGNVGRDQTTGEAFFEAINLEKKQKFYTIMTALEVLGKDRIVISGANGSGKSTLLAVLKGCQTLSTKNISDPHDLISRGNDIRVGWFAQKDEKLILAERVIARAMKNFPDDRDEKTVRAKLAGAGIPAEDLVKRMSELSYGQRVKIRFLQLMVSAYDILLLDEPTNHLDIQTRESLEMMLQQYEGALILVSHDRWFVEQVGVMKQWVIEDEMMEESVWVSRKSIAEESPFTVSFLEDKEQKDEEEDAYDFLK